MAMEMAMANLIGTIFNRKIKCTDAEIKAVAAAAPAAAPAAAAAAAPAAAPAGPSTFC